MALKQKYKKQEDIPENSRHLFEEKNGEWVFTGVEMEDTSALKAAYERVKAAEKALRSRFGNLPEDLDAEQIIALLEEKKQREEEGAKKAGEFDKLKEQLVQQHQKELAKTTERAAGLEKAIQKLVLDNAVMRTFEDMKDDIRSPELLRPHVLNALRVTEVQPFTFQVEVLGEDGQPRIGDSKGVLLSPKQLVEEMRAKDAFAPAFNAPKSSGSGAGEDGKRVPPGPGAAQKLSDLRTTADKVAYVQAHGQEAFENLVAASAAESAASSQIAR